MSHEELGEARGRRGSPGKPKEAMGSPWNPGKTLGGPWSCPCAYRCRQHMADKAFPVGLPIISSGDLLNLATHQPISGWRTSPLLVTFFKFWLLKVFFAESDLVRTPQTC